MNYITRKRFKKDCLSGKINLPFNTKCPLTGNIITYNQLPICFNTSQDAYDYFVTDYDSQGLKRAELINRILKLTDIKAKTYSSRWFKIWNTSSMQKYRRAEHEDVWLWNHDFYNASIEELEKIYTLIK